MRNCLNCESSTKNPKFCGHSCSASFNNKKREHGHLRSKLEKWIDPRLKEYYPELKIDFNRKDACGSELDIYFPDLKMAIELNGSYHYVSIIGEKYLKRVQENDRQKAQACKDHNIKLVVIDTSKVSYVTKKTGWQYLRMIMEEIEKYDLR